MDSKYCATFLANSLPLLLMTDDRNTKNDSVNMAEVSALDAVSNNVLTALFIGASFKVGNLCQTFLLRC